MQAPQWTEFLQCPICLQAFSETVRLPISLACGHTACKSCLHSLQRKQCQFCSSPIHTDIDKLPINGAILQLTGVAIKRLTADELDALEPDDRALNAAKVAIENLALLLKPLSGGATATAGSNHAGGGSSGGGGLLSRPMQRKLVTLINCQLVEPEGRARALRAARSLGERTVTELLLQHQNQQQLSSNLWAAVRQRGCQFLGPALQEECLRLILLALKDGEQLARKTLVMFVVQKLQEKQYQQASKTSVGHVVQLLYRASCFKVTKRDDDSSLMELKEEFRAIEPLRREHDAQIVQIAMEAGLRIAPDQWSSLLYGDTVHKSHMQSIIDKLQTNDSFSHSIDELVIALTRSGDPHTLGELRQHFEFLSQISPSIDSPVTDWEKTTKAMEAAEAVVNGLVKFIQSRQNSKPHEFAQQPFNNRYKTSMCKDMQQKGACPRGPSCTFAHSEDEMERYRFMRRSRTSQTKEPLPPIAPPGPHFQATAPIHPSQFGPYPPQPPPQMTTNPYYAPHQPVHNFYEQRPLIRPMSQSGYPMPHHHHQSAYNSLPAQPKFQIPSSQVQDSRYSSMPVNPVGTGFKDQSFAPPRPQHDYGYNSSGDFITQQNAMPPYQREAENGVLLVTRGPGPTQIVHPTPNPYDATMGGEYDSTERHGGFSSSSGGSSGRFNDGSLPYFEPSGFSSSGIENDFSGDYAGDGSGGSSGGVPGGVPGDQRVRKSGYAPQRDEGAIYRPDFYGSQRRPGRWSAGPYQQSVYSSYKGGYPDDYDTSGYGGMTFGGGSGGGTKQGLYDRKWSTGVIDNSKRNRYEPPPSSIPSAPFNSTTFGAPKKEDYGTHLKEKDDNEEEATTSDEMFIRKPFNGSVHQSSPSKPFSAAVGTPPSSKSPESKEVRKVSGVDGLFGTANVTDAADLSAVWENKTSSSGVSISSGPASSPATVASSSSSGLRASPWSNGSTTRQGDSWGDPDGWPVSATNQDGIEARLAELKRKEDELNKREALVRRREEEQRKVSQTMGINDEQIARILQKEMHEREKLGEEELSSLGQNFHQMHVGESRSSPPSSFKSDLIGGWENSSGGTNNFGRALDMAVTEEKVAKPFHPPRGSPLESSMQ